MLLRRIVPVALAAVVVVGCQPSVPSGNPPSSIDYVVFDPSTSQIPLPNDLGLQASAIASQSGAQQELLQLFAAQGGYPNDQELPVTIDLQRSDIGKSEITTSAPPQPLDVATLTPLSFLFLEKKPGAAVPVPVTDLEPPTYATSADGTKGTLTIRRKPDPTTKSRRWNAGSQYIVALRTGPQGAKLVGGGELTPMATMYFLTQGVKDGRELPGTSLAFEQNQYLLPVPAGWTGSPREGRAQTGNQLELLRLNYLPLFGAVDAAWGSGAAQQLGSIQTFTIAPSAGTQVVTDASAGVVPLPSDLLLDPANGGKTIVNNPAFGPLAAGIATLDGFSTTAMILSSTSGPVVAATVNKDTVFLYDLSNPAAPVRVKEVKEGAGAGFVAEPFVITRKADGTTPCTATDPATGCFSTAIGLQPAALVSSAPVISLPPLKEATEYAVLVTDGVLAAPTSAQGQPAPLKRSTLSSILLFQNPLYDPATQKALLSGQDPAQSAGLEQIRQGVGAAAAALSAEKSIPKSKIVLGYTFRTQTITDTALKLAALPYQTPAAFAPGTFANVTAGFPALAGVAEILTVSVPTINPIDPATGALNPNTALWSPSLLNALVVVPASSPTACPAPNAALKCAPLVVFGHGLGGNKTNVAAIASALASAGFVVAAIDAPLHGDRSYCTSDAECVCPTPAGSCTAPKCNLFPAPQPGDTVRAGLCGGGSVANLAVPGISGRFAVTGNLFRMRDGFREMVLDTSALVLALAPPAPAANALAQELGSKGIAIDGRSVYWVGQSLGGLMGTINLAVNPRFSRGVLNVPGATITDILTTSPTFKPQIEALVASQLGIQPNTPEFLQFVQVAKLALDAGDPANFAPHITRATLPNLLAGQATPPAQPAKNVFGQWAECDSVVPNSTNLFVLDQIGLSPTPTSSPNAYTMYRAGGGTPPTCNPPNANPAHGFLLSPTGDPNATAAGQADAVGYLTNLAVPATATRP